MSALESLKERIDYVDLPKQAQRAVDLTLEACQLSQQAYVDRCKELAAEVVHYQDRINELLGEGYKVLQERDALQAEVERLKSINSSYAPSLDVVSKSVAALEQEFFAAAKKAMPFSMHSMETTIVLESGLQARITIGSNLEND